MSKLQNLKTELPSPISSGYNVAQNWERNAPLSTEQQGVVDQLSQSCSRWPFQEVEESADESSSGQLEKTTSGKQISLDAKFSSSEEFYKWFSEVEAIYLSETEGRFREYADNLSSHSKSLRSVLEQVDDALKQFDLLRLQQNKIRSKTQTIQNTCERLSREREQLEEFASAVKSKLDFFDELHRLGNDINSAGKYSAEDFIDSLARIDECIAYLTSNPQYTDSGSYLTKFRTLQHKALSSVKSFVSSAFSKATEKVALAQKNVSAAHGAENSGAETTLLYVQFKAAVPDLRKVIDAIQNRLSRQDYSRLMHDIQSHYSEKRVEILSDAVEDQLISYQSSNDLPMLTRLGCAYLVQVTQMEYQLFTHFFPPSDVQALKQVITPLCTILYDILRPYFITMYSITGLCSLVNILNAEVLEEQFGSKEEALAAMRPMIEEILADVQGRLVYAMQQYIREEITLYSPSKEDLNYPQILEKEKAESEGNQTKEVEEPITEDFSHLYAPVQNTLLCLSKTYGCLESKTFGGLAQEAIQSCTETCFYASQSISKSASILDSQLFLIKNLLALREQLGMFEADFGSDEMELDFTHMRDHLRRILRGESSLFATGAANAVFQLMSSGRPRINKMHVDSKKDLEKRLKASCEAFIMAVTKITVDPMLSFITKVTATKVANIKKALKDQAFATPSKLTEIVKSVNESLKDDLPKSISKMKLYLKSQSTHSVLLKPIKSNIAEAHGQIAQLLEREYDQQTINMVQLTPANELMSILETLT